MTPSVIWRAPGAAVCEIATKLLTDPLTTNGFSGKY